MMFVIHFWDFRNLALQLANMTQLQGGYVTPCNLVDGHQHFGGICYYHLAGRKVVGLPNYQITGRRQIPEER
jgi:hypothetical protein